jgi:hypothetical protein
MQKADPSWAVLLLPRPRVRAPRFARREVKRDPEKRAV